MTTDAMPDSPVHRLFHGLFRAATASPKEWQCRTREAIFVAHNLLASFRGRSALSSNGHLKALRLQAGEIGPWWKARRNTWFMDVEREKALKASAQDFDSQLPWVLKRADLVVSGKMPLFSYDPVEFVGTDRWHRDFILEKTSPRKVYAFVRYLDVKEVGDSKHVWEPNRFGWAIWLGLAYRITADRKYADKFAELTSDWFDQNPYPIGINFCSALEVGLRNYAWLWALDLFSDYLISNAELLDRMVQGIWIGCRHIESNLSYYFAPNTHIIGEVFSLFACGAAIPDFSNSPCWRLLGQSILASEAKKQFHEDGTHRELSSGYHVYSTDFYLHTVLIALQTGFQVPPVILRTALRLGTRLGELAAKDLVTPQWNDCDGGRLMSLVPSPLDAGPSLMATQMLNADLSVVGDDIPTRGYPLLMSPRKNCISAKAPFNTPLPLTLNNNVAGLYDSGIVSYANEAGDYVVFRASPFGYQECPHSHDAPLGVIIHLGGQPIVVDSGTGSYAQRAERNQFRSAPGKNTILVNGRGPSRPGSEFRWERTTDCDLVSLKKFSDGIRAKGKHAGFSDPPHCYIFVQREVIALESGIVAIVDRWDTDFKISVRVDFTLHPTVDLDPARQMLNISGKGTAVHFLASSVGSNDRLAVVTKTVPFSPNYGQVGETTSLGFESTASRHGIVTIFSRVGQITQLPNGEIRFGENNFIHFVMTERGIKPLRRDVKQQLEDIPIK